MATESDNESQLLQKLLSELKTADDCTNKIIEIFSKLLTFLEGLKTLEQNKHRQIKILFNNYAQFKEKSQLKQNKDSLQEITALNDNIIEGCVQAIDLIKDLLAIHPLLSQKVSLRSEEVTPAYAIEKAKIIHILANENPIIQALKGLKSSIEKISREILKESVFFTKDAKEAIKSGYIWAIPLQKMVELKQEEKEELESAIRALKFTQLFQTGIHQLQKLKTFIQPETSSMLPESVENMEIDAEAFNLFRLSRKASAGHTLQPSQEIRSPTITLEQEKFLANGGEKVVYTGKLGSQKVAIGYIRSLCEGKTLDKSGAKRVYTLYATLLRLKATSYLPQITRPKAIVFLEKQHPVIITQLFEFFGEDGIHKFIREDPKKNAKAIVQFFTRLFYECSFYRVFCTDSHPGNIGITPDGRIEAVDAGFIKDLKEGIAGTPEYFPAACLGSAVIPSKEDGTIDDLYNYGILYWSLATVFLKKDSTLFSSNNTLFDEGYNTPSERYEKCRKRRKEQAEHILNEISKKNKQGFDSFAQLIPESGKDVESTFSKKEFTYLFSYYYQEIESGLAKFDETKNVIAALLAHLTPYVYETVFEERVILPFSDFFIHLVNMSPDIRQFALLEKMLGGAAQAEQTLREFVLANNSVSELIKGFYTPLADMRFSDAIKLYHGIKPIPAVPSSEIPPFSRLYLQILIIAGAYAELNPEKLQSFMSTPLGKYITATINWCVLLSNKEMEALLKAYGLEKELSSELLSAIGKFSKAAETFIPSKGTA